MAERGGDGRPPDPLSIRRRETPDRVGLIDAESDEDWSYAALDDAADGVADRLREIVDGPDRTIALLSGTRPAVLPLSFGGLRAGVRVGLLDVNLDDDSLADRLDRLDPDLVVCEAATEEQAMATADVPIVSVDRSAHSDIEGIDAFPGPSSGQTEAPRATDFDLGELVAFTSGTTGESNGVRLPLETLVASAVASALRLGVATDDRWLVPIPTYHVGGFSPFVRCTQAGTTVVLQREFDADSTVDAMERWDVTCVSLVPTQLARILDAGWEPPETLRFALVGGGPVPSTLIDRCRDRGVPICPTYGTTETASQVATALPETAFAHPGTVGRPLAFTDVSVVDDDEHGHRDGVEDAHRGDVEVGERDGAAPRSGDAVGEIVVDGPTVTPGYLDATHRPAFDDDGFHTGDVGRVDDAGRLWIEGRLDDRIVTGGENVSASAVAEVIGGINGVSDVAVVGLPDPEWGKRVGALVVADQDLDAEAVRSHCRDLLATYAVPKTVTVTDELPRTPSGTVDRTAVERLLR